MDMHVNGTNMQMHRHHGLMHMTFFWGNNALILFTGWPGESLGMYILALVLVFLASVSLEWLSHCSLLKPTLPGLTAGIAQTGLHTVRTGLSYLVMLALMSFNGGVFLVAVAGHAVGFFLFGSRVFKPVQVDQNATDLPPMKC